MKRHIKKFALTLILAGGIVVGFGGIALAGGGGHGGQFGGPGMFKKLDGMSEQERLEFLENKLDERLTRMTKNLELTKDQQLRARQVMADAQTQLLEIYEKNKAVDDKSAAKTEAHVVLKQARQDISDLLSDEQKAKQRAQRDEHAKRFKGKMVDRLDEKLELSDAQRAKVEQILERTHAKMKANRDKPGDDKAARAKGKKLIVAAADDINKVLTKDQQTKFAQMRERFEDGRRDRKGRGAF